MGIIALDLGIRGAAAGLFLMIMFVILIRTRPLSTIKLLGAAMAAQTVAYLIATAPFVPKSTLWWTLPLMAGNPVVIWLWAKAWPAMVRETRNASKPRTRMSVLRVAVSRLASTWPRESAYRWVGPGV